MILIKSHLVCSLPFHIVFPLPSSSLSLPTLTLARPPEATDTSRTSPSACFSFQWGGEYIWEGQEGGPVMASSVWVCDREWCLFVIAHPVFPFNTAESDVSATKWVWIRAQVFKMKIYFLKLENCSEGGLVWSQGCDPVFKNGVAVYRCFFGPCTMCISTLKVSSIHWQES